MSSFGFFFLPLQRKLAMFPENPLIRLERHANSTDYVLRQVGYCARWCLDNYCKWSCWPNANLIFNLNNFHSPFTFLICSYYRRTNVFLWGGWRVKRKCYAEHTRRVGIFENFTRRLGGTMRCLSIRKCSVHVSSEFWLLVLRSIDYYTGSYANRLGNQRLKFS